MMLGARAARKPTERPSCGSLGRAAPPAVPAVVYTPDVVGARMAGPGIRAWYFARELARIADVTLIAKLEQPEAIDGVRLVQHGSAAAELAMREAQLVIAQPGRGVRRRRREQRLVYDLFDPVVLELRELYGSAPSLRQRLHLVAEWWRLLRALRSADLLIAATARQRDFYLPLQSGDAPWVEIPFGIDMREISSCAKPQDHLLIWGGGIWEWLDPETAVEAVVRLNGEGLRCRLLFLGRARPNPELAGDRRENRFDNLLAAGTPFVSANDSWVPYRERLSWLRSGKIAIMLHHSTTEAEYSIRTRLFDAIAAGIPVVATEKGFAAELVKRESLGLVVPPDDAAAVAAAVRKLLTDDAFHLRCVENLERIRPRYAWEAVMGPLIEKVSEWQTQAP